MSSKSNLLHFPKQPDALVPAVHSVDYEQLLRDLREEHRPEGPVEQALVQQMAQQRELMDRWMILQQRAFSLEAVPKDLPTMMRQHAAAERSFHQALSALLNFRKSRSK